MKSDSAADTRSLFPAIVALAGLLAAGLTGCGAAEADFGYPGSSAGPAQNYQQGENYESQKENSFVRADKEPESTFGIDVDTGSYTLMRRDIENGKLPVKDGVRPEEYINFFQYDYTEPEGDHPVAIDMEAGPSPFGQNKKMMRIGIKGREIVNQNRKPTNLVFLLDVSGSMQSGKKLGLVKKSMYTLLDGLRPSDSVGIVVYAGADGVVLDPTEVRNEQKIKDAIDKLSAGGSTNGEAGIVRAYKMAEEAKIEGGNNRVILCTDGDFNVGKTGDALVDLIKKYREKRIGLSTVGFGMGNYNDATMEKLARNGNGNYFYVDSKQEARRIFGSELTSTLELLAADVKVQVAFNDKVVKRYRLVGYENRKLENEDFEDDEKDAGDMGPGHTVTAFYELEMTGQAPEDAQLSEIRLRYKDDFGGQSKLMKKQLKRSDVRSDLDEASTDYRFGLAVAEYAEILRGSKHSDGAKFDRVLELARGAADSKSKRTEFIGLAEKAQTLWKKK
jgi:Ca-activated chloride channel family protein